MSQNEQQSLELLTPDRGIAPSSTSNSGQVTDTLKRAMERGHLVSPSTTCPNLPIGCEVAFSAVLINPKSSEVYSVGGKLGLAKPALDKIAKAVGVNWDPIQSRRLDDGSDPYFASYRAVGFYRHFDGTMMQIMGEKQMDLHDDSEWAKKLTPGELSMQRKFIAEHAETKARLRAIRSLGLQTSYTEAELAKPFIVAKLMLTGRVSREDDPTGELQKILTHNISNAMMGGNRMLYGQEPVSETAPQQIAESSAGNVEPDGSPAMAAASFPIESDKPAETTQQPQCTPDQCFGKGASHVKACYETAPSPVASTTQPATTAASAPAGEAWVITDGSMKGIPVTDQRVTNEHLGSLLDLFTSRLESGEDLSEDDVNRIKHKRRQVEAELTRRGVL